MKFFVLHIILSSFILSQVGFVFPVKKRCAKSLTTIVSDQSLPVHKQEEKEQLPADYSICTNSTCIVHPMPNPELAVKFFENRLYKPFNEASYQYTLLEPPFMPPRQVLI